MAKMQAAPNPYLAHVPGAPARWASESIVLPDTGHSPAAQGLLVGFCTSSALVFNFFPLFFFFLPVI